MKANKQPNGTVTHGKTMKTALLKKSCVVVPIGCERWLGIIPPSADMTRVADKEVVPCMKVFTFYSRGS